MAKRIVLLAVGLLAILTIVLVSIPSSPVSLTPKASTGVFLTGCAYDSEGKVLGCSYSQRAPLGQSLLTSFGGSIDSLKIPSAYLKLNYTGQASSWAFTSTELVQYEKGVSDSYPITVSGSGNPGKTMNLTLPKSAWTSSELQGKFTGYGQKVVNASITNCSWTFTFTNSMKVLRPCAYNYFVQFNLNYGQTSVSTSTTTSVSTTVSTTTTASSTTIGGGSITTGTQDAWITTVSSATNGVTGSQSQSGFIVTVAPDYYTSSQSVVWIYGPPSLNTQNGFFVNLVTRSISLGTMKSSLGANHWSLYGFVVSLKVSDSVIVSIADAGTGSILFNQAIAVSSPTAPNQSVCNLGQGQVQYSTCSQANIPPQPYQTRYFAFYNTFDATNSPYALPLSQESLATYQCSGTGGIPFLSTTSACAIPVQTTSTTLASDQCYVTNMLSGGTYITSGKACTLSVMSVKF